jgi:hypothetical protein
MWGDEESMYRSGVRTPGAVYMQNNLGGAAQRIPLYRMDAKRTLKDTEEGLGCKKKEESRGPISPGVLVRKTSYCYIFTYVAYIHTHIRGNSTYSYYIQGKPFLSVPAKQESNTYLGLSLLQIVWCAACEAAVSWSLMADSESPSSLFELLVTYFNDGSFHLQNQMRVVYDNACNFMTYGLNRDPEFMKGIDAVTDGFHGTKGHPKCSKGFFARVFCAHCFCYCTLPCRSLGLIAILLTP